MDKWMHAGQFNLFFIMFGLNVFVTLSNVFWLLFGKWKMHWSNFCDTFLNVCLDNANTFSRRIEGWATPCPPTLMETANYSLEVEKRQIAISSSSERDKGTFPCSESLARPERHLQKHLRSESEWSNGKDVNGHCSESESQKGRDTNRSSSESPACKGETIADQHPFRIQERTAADHVLLNLWPVREEAITDTKPWVSSFEAGTRSTTFWACEERANLPSDFRVFVQRHNNRCSTSWVSILRDKADRINLSL